VGDAYRGPSFINSVDADVPVPHFGLCQTVAAFHTLAARLRAAAVPFVIEPHLRFVGAPGEQLTMFFRDPSMNNLEFKAMTQCVYTECPALSARTRAHPTRPSRRTPNSPENLFASYKV